MLQVYSPKKKIVSRLIKNDEGKLCRVFFAVVEWNGQIFAKPIKVELVSDCDFEAFEKCALCAPKEKTAVEFALEIFYKESPYFDKRNLAFVSSQRTRAPSLN